MQEERYGFRDAVYSIWHRTESIKRYVDREEARQLSMIDLDGTMYIEYEDGSNQPLALIEVAQDVGQDHKTGIVTEKLARRAWLPAFVVLYKHSSELNPTSLECDDIKSFRVYMLFPRSKAKGWKHFSPRQYANFLLEIRRYMNAVLKDALPPEYPEVFTELQELLK